MPGLYMMFHNPLLQQEMAEKLSDKFSWERVQGAAKHLNLYVLIEANAQKSAAILSCHQKIAAGGAFSIAMLGEFDTTVNQGAWAYKQLFWEAGILGQVLYLEAEAIGLRGTGIGCFFDDAVHEMLGIKDTQWQSIYHFTVGGELSDSRLRTILPYTHREEGSGNS